MLMMTMISNQIKLATCVQI